jgi:hypothetical protein
VGKFRSAFPSPSQSPNNSLSDSRHNPMVPSQKCSTAFWSCALSSAWVDTLSRSKMLTNSSSCSPTEQPPAAWARYEHSVHAIAGQGGRSRTDLATERYSKLFDPIALMARGSLTLRVAVCRPVVLHLQAIPETTNNTTASVARCSARGTGGYRTAPSQYKCPPAQPRFRILSVWRHSSCAVATPEKIRWQSQRRDCSEARVPHSCSSDPGADCAVLAVPLAAHLAGCARYRIRHSLGRALFSAPGFDRAPRLTQLAEWRPLW